MSDPDAELVRRTARTVGVRLALAAAVLVVVVLAVAFVVVFTQVPLGAVFGGAQVEPIDVSPQDVVIGGIVVGLVAIAGAGILALAVTRRAVAPLADALARQRRFVADASHELRTPLAVLDTRIQLLQRVMDDDDPNRELVDELRDDSRGLIDVVTDLLEAADTTGEAHAVSVGDVMDAAARTVGLLARDREVAVRTSADDVQVLGTEQSLQRALVALLDNAVKHSPAGTTVSVTAQAVRGMVEIAVADEGPGIRGIDPAHVFDRFARSSEAVDGGGDSAMGFGIGLSLVRDTAARFGGSVAVTRTGPAGTTITLRLRAA